MRVGVPPTRTNRGHDMTYEYDVIVVGGRVAGSSTAMLLASRGHKVLIIERAEMPSDTISTHAVMRTGVLQLTRWGVLDRVIGSDTPPIRNITLGFGDERIPFQIKPEFGVDTFYGPRRYLLDDALAKVAEDAGAEFRGHTTVTDLLHRSDGGVMGVRVGHKSGGEPITARWVIGADGYKSRVADLVGSQIYRSHDATNAVSYGYYEGVDADGFWFQFTPGVNAGLIPTNDEQCLVFCGRPTVLQPRFNKDPDGEFLRLVEQAGSDLYERVREGARVGRFRGNHGLPGFMRQAWGAGWALVGDAGYTKDPISAHGMSDALRDAELCARAIDQALRSPDLEAESLTWYETLRNSMSERIYQESETLAAFEWSAEEASARMRVISDEIRAECETLLSLPDWSAAPARATA